MTNVEIANLIQAFSANPTDPIAIESVHVFKSGARSGTTHGMMIAVEALPRNDDCTFKCTRLGK